MGRTLRSVGVSVAARRRHQRTSTARDTHRELLEEGLTWPPWIERIEALGHEQRVPEHRLEHMIEKLVSRGLLWEKDPRSLYDALPLAVAGAATRPQSP